MGLLYPLMTSRSADEFIFDIALAQGSLKFQVLDYLAIIIGTGYNNDVTPIAQLIVHYNIQRHSSLVDAIRCCKDLSK